MNRNELNIEHAYACVPHFIRPAEPITEMFVVASGPSIKSQNLTVLPRDRTIAVNRSFEVVDAAYSYITDSNLVEWILEDRYHSKDLYLTRPKYRVCPSPMARPGPNRPKLPVLYVRRSLHKEVSVPRLDRLWCGSNSGFAAIQLAIWLGAKRVNLLGFDLNCVGGSHWHKGYGAKPAEGYDRTLVIFKAELEEYAPKFAAAGVDVVNLTPGSSLTCFRCEKLEDCALTIR